MAINVRLNKLQLKEPLEVLLPRTLAAAGISELPLRIDHAMRLKDLPMHHRDPFDRPLIVQTVAERLSFVTNDAEIHRYQIPIVW
jgi:PIN domain nuclease of toxin-antitoxin system